MTSHILIREARRRAGLTQSELAERAGTTQSSIARWETGRALPSIEKLQQLIRCCGFELTFAIVPHVEEEWALLDRHLGLSHAERIERLVAAVSFLRDEGIGGHEAPPSTTFDPLAIFDAMQRHGVRYVLVGGLAATLHGSPIVTPDVDLVPEPSEENAARLARALEELQARDSGETSILRVDGESGEPGSARTAEVRRLSTRAGALDLILEPRGTSGYADLRQGALDVEIGSTMVVVATLADVIRSKEAAGREVDREALPTLRRLQRRLSSPAGRGARGNTGEPGELG